ncbi:BatD family protein [Psychroserpens luteolus]|uniref:BatD family protein n=1 Tax=Psychroserpens luteolus TaxID=2855840 RepID=UPI001E491616|nr:BatD family protein [Psychroserpens luteolus]MCD2258490.1 BatD family protein [Psychroserpens luteolus]
MKSIKQTLLLLSIFSVGIVFAQVNFEVKVSKDKVAPNESIRVDFEMDAEEEEFTPPSFSDFEVVSGPQKNVSRSWIKGEESYKKTITYYVVPQKQGDLTIDQARMTVDDETYLTKPMSVKVNDMYKSKEDNPQLLKFNNTVHLVAEVSKKTVSVGSSIEVTYTLYVSPEVGISNWKALTKPEYEDFESEDIDVKPLKVEDGTYKGEKQRYVVLSKTKLTSKEKGQFQLEPLKLNVTVEMPTDKNDIFGSPVMQTINKTLTTNVITVTVK